MEKLVKSLATEMLNKDVTEKDAQTAIGCLDTKAHFEKMLKEVRKAKSLNRATILSLAVLITDNEL